jgi:hypothetical protein
MNYSITDICPACEKPAVICTGDSIAYGCGTHARPDGKTHRVTWVCLETRRLHKLVDTLKEESNAQ